MKSRSFTESKILEQNDIYEVEIEIDSENSLFTEQMPQISKYLKSTIKYVQCGLQNTEYPIGISDIQMTMEDYQFIEIKVNKHELKEKPSSFIGPSSYTLQKKNIVKHEKISAVNIINDFAVTDKADGERRLLFIDFSGKFFFINTNFEFMYCGCDTTQRILMGTIIDGEFIKYDRYGNMINEFAMFDLYFTAKKTRDTMRSL